MRRLQRRLEHWQANVAQARADIAAYRGDEHVDAASDGALRRAAVAAVSRAEAVLEYIGTGDERMLGEFRALYDAVAPVIARGDDVPSVA